MILAGLTDVRIKTLFFLRCIFKSWNATVPHPTLPRHLWRTAGAHKEERNFVVREDRDTRDVTHCTNSSTVCDHFDCFATIRAVTCDWWILERHRNSRHGCIIFNDTDVSASYSCICSSRSRRIPHTVPVGVPIILVRTIPFGVLRFRNVNRHWFDAGPHVEEYMYFDHLGLSIPIATM